MIVQFKTEEQLISEYGPHWRTMCTGEGFSFIDGMEPMLGTIRDIYFDSKDAEWHCHVGGNLTWYIDIRWVTACYKDFFEAL